MYKNIVSLSEKKYQKWVANPSVGTVDEIGKIKVLIIHGDEEEDVQDLLETIPSNNKIAVNIQEAQLQIEKAYQDEDPFQVIMMSEETLKNASEKIALWFLYQPYLQNSYFIVITNNTDSLLIRMLRSEARVGTMDKLAKKSKITEDYLTNVCSI